MTSSISNDAPTIATGLASLLAASAQAYDGLTSELSHGAGGAAWGGITTIVASDHWPEHRVLLGVGVATTACLIGEWYDRNRGQGFSTLVVVATAAGGVIGALVTSRFILMPVATRAQEGGRYVGVVARYSF
jgi:hypothetical protein